MGPNGQKHYFYVMI